MDNLINSKSIKYRINAINTKLSDNSRLINNTNNLIPTTITISDDNGNYYIQEHYADTTYKTFTISDLDGYLDNINQIQIKYKLDKPIIVRVLAEKEWGN